MLHAVDYNFGPTSTDKVFGLVQSFKLSTTGNISAFKRKADLAMHVLLGFRTLRGPTRT